MQKGVVLTALTLLGTCLPFSARAQTALRAQLFDTGTARDVGMGGAVTAVADDLAMALWNPACVARLEGRQAVVSDSLGTTPKGLRLIAYGQAEEDDLTGALTYLRVDNRTYATKESTVMYSFGRGLSPRSVGGVNLKYSRYERYGSAKEAFNADFGLLYGLTDTVTLGVAVLNINEPRMMDAKTLSPTFAVPGLEAPRTLNLGVAAKLHPQVAPGMLGTARRTYRTCFSFEIFDATNEVRQQLRFGVEHQLTRVWTARAGLLRSTPTFGLGFQARGYAVNGAVLIGRRGERPAESFASFAAQF